MNVPGEEGICTTVSGKFGFTISTRSPSVWVAKLTVIL